MTSFPDGVPLVEVVRSGVVESVHRGHVIVVDADGQVRTELGAVDAPMFARSSLKPLQAVGMVRAGLPLVDGELAMAAASHDGEPIHLATVGSVLADGGLAEDDLECPPDLPAGEDARRSVLAAGGGPTRLQMNCSGKHAAMLRTCVVHDWPLSGYTAPTHPLQQHLHDSVSELSAHPVTSVGVDGCGAPLFGLTLRAVARAFSVIASATEGAERKVADAMRRYPNLVGGTTQSTSRLLAGVAGSVVKGGAEGVYAAALPDGGCLAVKIADGAPRAADRVVVAALRRLGVDAPVLDELAEAPVLGGGRPVGAVRMALDL